MLTAVIIDDEAKARRNLSQLLNKYCSSIKILGDADGVISGEKLIRNEHPNVVFLDIQMQDGTGFDLLGRFPNSDFHTVFVTAYDHFAIMAFEFNALDYLLKPINISRLVQSVSKLKRTQGKDQYLRQITNLLRGVQQKHFETIVLQTQERQYYIKLEDVVRLHSENNYTMFYMDGDKRVIVSETIKRYEELLPNDIFFRTHQSHIVNRHHIVSFLKSGGGGIEMADGFLVPVARRKRDAFFTWIKKELQ